MESRLLFKTHHTLYGSISQEVTSICHKSPNPWTVVTVRRLLVHWQFAISPYFQIYLIDYSLESKPLQILGLTQSLLCLEWIKSKHAAVLVIYLSQKCVILQIRVKISKKIKPVLHNQSLSALINHRYSNESEWDWIPHQDLQLHTEILSITAHVARAAGKRVNNIIWQSFYLVLPV